LKQLTHERDLVQRGIADAADLPSTALAAQHSTNSTNNNSAAVAAAAAGARSRAYALEMEIQIKRAEREHARQTLETEFAATLASVESKRRQLSALQGAIGDMEATRARKEREFARIQVLPLLLLTLLIDSATVD
jgi:GMP synthase PP-ATPase subunit